MAGWLGRIRDGIDWRGDGPKRTGVLIMCVVCTLARCVNPRLGSGAEPNEWISGSNYAYSAYAPQLASQLRLTSTQINLVGTAGNFGVYMTGPL